MKKKIHNRELTYKLFEKPPTTNKEKKIGDIWFAKVPYHEKGNWYKPRPVLIVDYVGDKYLCKKITSKYRPGRKKIKVDGQISYVSCYITLNEYNFYSLKQRGVNVEDYIQS